MSLALSVLVTPTEKAAAATGAVLATTGLWKRLSCRVPRLLARSRRSRRLMRRQRWELRLASPRP